MNVSLSALALATAYAAQQWPSIPVAVEAVHGLDKWPTDIVVLRLQFHSQTEPVTGWVVATPQAVAYSSESQAVALGALVMGREVPGALFRNAVNV